ncbi:NAD(P)-dependent alcohol dehydrogenase [Bacillus sp. CGMCC 1.16607]|uniref:NAD(P)-dependent alcohol dehydrogenase n=1 Tax=Bacillus sp. CGMCC 1.16607 TaxID=3351842 RepID=UPI00362DAC24
MKAIVYNEYGTADVLKLKEVNIPAIKDNEVLVKVHAVSVNSWDWDLLRGKPFLARLGGLNKPKFKILGADIAGKVEAIGSGVKQFMPGDAVFGDISWCGWGGFAEYVSVREDALTLKPDVMTFEEAAAIPQAAVLALQGIRDKGQIKEGQKVLINGAGGGVGTFALQIAKLYGAEVTCVDRASKLDMLQSLGADHVLDYTREDFIQKGQCYDLILDVVGSRSIFNYKRILNPKGTYVMVGGPLSLILQLVIFGPLISKVASKNMNILFHRPNQNDQNVLKELFLIGSVKPVIDRQFSLSEVGKAIQYLGEGHAKGKVVIVL